MRLPGEIPEFGNSGVIVLVGIIDYRGGLECLYIIKMLVAKAQRAVRKLAESEVENSSTGPV